jgi:hypothetical protein
MSEPLFVPMDHAIIMHRETHFDGSFEQMIAYYERGGEGMCPDFSLKRIEELARYEEEQGQDIAELFLFHEEKEQVDEAKQSYHYLKALQKVPHKENPVPQLTADLILAETEEDLEEAIANLSRWGDLTTKAMIDLLRSDDLHDPIFPGYGLSPMRAARVIARMGDKQAIVALFEAIGQEEDFFDEEILISALKNIGAPAKEFLLRLATRSSRDHDSEKAIVALSAFKGESDVAEACLKLLSQPNIHEDSVLASYLIFNCEGLSKTSDRETFITLAKSGSFTREQKEDMASIVKGWS